MRRPLWLIASCLAALALGCGGDDGLSAEQYATELDSLCEQTRDYFADLAARASEEDLDSEEVAALVADQGEDVSDSIEALDPPEELSDEHERLVALRDQFTPDPATEDGIEYFEEVRDIFAASGADGCVKLQEASISQLRAEQEAP